MSEMQKKEGPEGLALAFRSERLSACESYEELMGSELRGEPLEDRVMKLTAMIEKDRLDSSQEGVCRLWGDRTGPLYWAARLGAWEMIEPLSKLGANLNEELNDEKLSSIAHVAAESCQSAERPRTLRELLRCGAKLTSNWDGETAVFFAKDDALEALKEGGANLSEQSFDGRTELWETVTGWSSDETIRLARVKELLRLGANPNALGPDDEAPLHASCKFSLPRITEELLRAGANPEALNGDRVTPLTLAITYASGPRAGRLVAALLAAGVEPSEAETEMAKRASELNGNSEAWDAMLAWRERRELEARVPAAQSGAKKLRM